MKIKQVSYEDAVKNNPSEYCSVKRPEERDFFFRDMHILEFAELEKKYGSPRKVSFIDRIKGLMKKILRKLGGGQT